VSDEEERAEDEVYADRIALMYKAILEGGSEGITQSDAWKKLNLTSREGSRIAIRLERRGLIRRERVVKDGRWTYVLIPLVKPLAFRSIETSPCLVCRYETVCRPGADINPINCPPDREGKGIASWALYEWRRLSHEEGG
jgi:DNA-binding Lrp family transcriptional regulator